MSRVSPIMVAHRTIIFVREGAAIVVRARAATPTPLTGSTAWSTAARALQDQSRAVVGDLRHRLCRPAGG